MAAQDSKQMNKNKNEYSFVEYEVMENQQVVSDYIQEVSSEDKSSLTMFQIARWVHSLIIKVKYMVKKNGARVSAEDSSRLMFLCNTTVELLTHMTNQSPATSSMDAYKMLVTRVEHMMFEVIETLGIVLEEKKDIDDGFDVMESSLRGYLNDFWSLFPIDAPLPQPSSLIEDHEARTAWEIHGGESCYFMMFDQFMNMLEKENVLPLNSPDVLFNSLKYFFDFPSGELVTPCKWGRFLRLFGSFRVFGTALEANISTKGFLGSINRIQAHQILFIGGGPRSYIMRFSRKEPGFIAFSYRNRDGYIGHLINKDENGNIIPIHDFIELKLPEYTALNMTLDYKKIVESNSMCIYASSSYTNYIK